MLVVFWRVVSFSWLWASLELVLFCLLFREEVEFCVDRFLESYFLENEGS